MREYTKSVCENKFTISPEDDNYAEKLLKVAESFRRFDVALDDFLVMQGYNGDISDTEDKIKFIKEKFDKSEIPFDVRNAKKWFYNHTRSTNRDIAFQFCFAFKLNIEQTQSFFRKIYLQRGIDCHDIKEAVYYFCIKNNWSYVQALDIIKKTPKPKMQILDLDKNVLFTSSIINEIDKFTSPDELITFFNSNIEQFSYNNATAYKYINEIWDKISCEGGTAYKEANIIYGKNKSKNSNRSVWNIYLQIFGYIDYDNIDNSKLFNLNTDRTLKPIFKGNSLIHPIVMDSFPDRQGLEGIIKGIHQSNEVVRKTLILLTFYRFWADLSVKNNTGDYRATQIDMQRCIAIIDRILIECGYPNLYAGNAYDWIFLFAAQSEYPLSDFRYFMREVYLNKKESE